MSLFCCWPLRFSHSCEGCCLLRRAYKLGGPTKNRFSYNTLDFSMSNKSGGQEVSISEGVPLNKTKYTQLQHPVSTDVSTGMV